jgi:hypothetical protein
LVDTISVEIIRPILRGRDIKRYGYKFDDLWLLFIPWHFPHHLDTSISGASDRAEIAFRSQYPAVYSHLLQYKDQLSNRNKEETGIRYEWYALQRWGANYWEDFSRQKIIYPEITKFLNFYLDNAKFFINNKCFIMTGKHLSFLSSFLNSSLFKFCFKDNFPELLGGTRELRKVFLEQIPIIQISDKINKEFEELVIELQNRMNKKLPTKTIELELDEKIFNIYQLTSEEKNTIGFIEIR